MTGTTKSLIQRNYWLPLGCKALLGSVNPYYGFHNQNDFNIFKKRIHFSLFGVIKIILVYKKLSPQRFGNW